MEPCMNPGETLTCHSPPPVFNVPEPVWRFPSTTTPTGSTTGIFTTEPTEATSPIVTPTYTTKKPCCESPCEPCCESPCELPSELNLPVIISCSVAGSLVLILIILAIIRYRKNKDHQNETASHLTTQLSTKGLIGADEPDGKNETASRLTTQLSTKGLIGTDEPDGKKQTGLTGNDTVFYESDGKFTPENDGKLTPENDDIYSPKDGIGDEDKTAPVVQMTEL